MSTFVVVLNPPLLVHLVDKALLCGHPACVELATAAVTGQADELPEPALFRLAALIIGRLHWGRLDPFVEIAWRDTLSAVRAALRMDGAAA